MSSTIVDPKLYDERYFLKDNDGWREWELGLDSNIHPKFKRALELAGDIKGKTVFDIGCGRGELIYYCVKRGAEVVGIDYSSSAIDVARLTISRLPEDLKRYAKAQVGDIGTYALKEKLDIVFMIEIAEHMYGWQLMEALDKIYYCLKPGGRLIIMTPNYLYEKYFSPIKRISNIPANLVKWPLRIARGKYEPKSFKELLGKIFKVKVDRGELNREMHVNVTTRNTLKRLLVKFDANIWCEDYSPNPIAFLTKRWFGRDIIAVATKRHAVV